VTPNRFELEWLTGLHARSISEAIAAARKLSAAEVLATSIPAAARQLATLVTSDEAVSQHIAPERAHVPHGTGDFLAGLYLAHRLAHAPAKALMLAMQTLERAMTLSIGSTVLNIAGALHSR
jgi:pyridoxine kinase